MLSAHGALANGVAGHYFFQKEKEERRRVAASMKPFAANADGFILAKQSFRVGPYFRFCTKDQGRKLYATAEGCAIKERDVPIWGPIEIEYTVVNQGLSAQEYLDHHFSKGVTRFAGISFHISPDNVVLFYQIDPSYMDKGIGVAE